MPIALIGLGSNRAQHRILPREIVLAAYRALGAFGALAGLSPVYKSTAWPDPDQPNYVNAVAKIDVKLTPMSLLSGLLAVESAFGRVRSDDPAARYAPRTLDLDLLDYDGQMIDQPGLQLPHPRMQTRGFVMRPLADLQPDWNHPVSGLTAWALASAIDEPGTVPLDA